MSEKFVCQNKARVLKAEANNTANKVPYAHNSLFIPISFLICPFLDERVVFSLVINSYRPNITPQLKQSQVYILHGAAAELTPGEGETFFSEDPSSSHGQAEREITVLARLSLL